MERILPQRATGEKERGDRWKIEHGLEYDDVVKMKTGSVMERKD